MNLSAELTDAKEQMESRIRELNRTRIETVRAFIEQSIIRLERERKEAEEQRALVNLTISDLEELVSNVTDLFIEYRNRIQDLLRNDEYDLKSGLSALGSSRVLEETGIKITLSSVNRKAPCSSVFVSARGSKQRANQQPALIADIVQLPPTVQLRSRSYIEHLICLPTCSGG